MLAVNLKNFLFYFDMKQCMKVYEETTIEKKFLHAQYGLYSTHAAVFVSVPRIHNVK